MHGLHGLYIHALETLKQRETLAAGKDITWPLDRQKVSSVFKKALICSMGVIAMSHALYALRMDFAVRFAQPARPAL